MQEFKISSTNKRIILALGAESAGNFSVFINGKIFFSQDFGNLQEITNFEKYKKELNSFLKEYKIKPNIILSDLHPFFFTTELAKNLAKKYKAEHISVQHHSAHIFSAIGDKILEDKNYKPKTDSIGIACDGTGYSDDGKIWGGEVFSFHLSMPILEIRRVGHLENQILLGGELAIKEPARVLISILSKFLSKDKVFQHIEKYYSKNEFELLWNQLAQNFNCLETSSTARILDAVSVLLGFSKNESLEKHGPVKLLEENSTEHYNDLQPKIETSDPQSLSVLNTTFLFEYLIKSSYRDKKRLAATAQKYIADGILEIINKNQLPVFFSGGMANNIIISKTLQSQGIYINKKIPRGDAGISFGQIFFFLLTNKS